MGLTLHQHSHSHGGSTTPHSHGSSGTSSTNINVRAAYIHVLGDIIQSLGVLVAAVIVYFRVSNYILRPGLYVPPGTFPTIDACWIYVLVKFDSAIRFRNAHILLSVYRNRRASARFIYVFIYVYNVNIIYLYLQ